MRAFLKSAMFGVIALILFVAPSSAATISFEAASIDRLDINGPYHEAGFTFTAVGDGWEIQNVFGNPASALATFFNTQGGDVGDTVDILRTGGGLFSFVSVDWSTVLAANSDDVLLTGFVGAAPVGSLAITGSTPPPPNTFATIASGFDGLDIDRLRVAITGGVGSNALVLDNFVFDAAPIPEPGSLLLLGAGLSAMAARRRMKGRA